MAKQHSSDEFGRDQHVAGTPVGLGLGSEGTFATRGADDETQVTNRATRVPGQVAIWKVAVFFAVLFALGVTVLVVFRLFGGGLVP